MELLKVGEVAEILSISESGLYYLVNRGMLKAVDIDGETMVMVESVESYREMQRRLRYSKRRYSVYIQERVDDYLDHMQMHPYAVAVGRIKTENGGNSRYVFLTKYNKSDWQDLVDPWIRHNSGERLGVQLEPLWL